MIVGVNFDVVERCVAKLIFLVGIETLREENPMGFPAEYCSNV